MKAKTFDQVLAENKGKPILVANRGIPARRLCRSISEMEAISIMTATDVDKTSPSTRSAQELMLLGEDPTSYLDIDRIIEKAKKRGVIAIHPGWGFAAEDYSFPLKCEEAGIHFIGPPHDAMRLLGNKVAVRKLAKELGVPVVPVRKMPLHWRRHVSLPEKSVIRSCSKLKAAAAAGESTKYTPKKNSNPLL